MNNDYNNNVNPNENTNTNVNNSENNNSQQNVSAQNASVQNTSEQNSSAQNIQAQDIPQTTAPEKNVNELNVVGQNNQTPNIQNPYRTVNEQPQQTSGYSNGYKNPYYNQNPPQNNTFTAYSGYDSRAYQQPQKENVNYNKNTHGNGSKGLGGKVIALVVCCCLVCSAVFGVGGAFLAVNLMGGSTDTQPSSGTSGSGLSFQSVQSDNNGVEDSNNAIVLAIDKAKSSVVEISTEVMTTSSFFGQYVTKGAGSGVIISTDGYIITCAHVVDGATSVSVTTSDGTKYDAKIIGEDEQTDIAVIKIEADGLNAAVIGSSAGLLVGETSIAIGNPLGELGGTATTGIISALGREVRIDGQSYTLLQTNAAINPGNSGGGLFNINGELIGIVNAKSSGSEIEGLGFAIPIDTAIALAEQLIDDGYISGRAMLGVNIYEVTTSTSASTLMQSGLSSLLNYITDYGTYFVSYNEPQSGDLQFGDRIVAIDGVTVSSLSDIKSLLTDYSVGDELTVTVARLYTEGRTSQSKMVDVALTLVEDIPDSVKSSGN